LAKKSVGIRLIEGSYPPEEPEDWPSPHYCNEARVYRRNCRSFLIDKDWVMGGAIMRRLNWRKSEVGNRWRRKRGRTGNAPFSVQTYLGRMGE
jgi:hypothetical protein